MLGVVYLDGEGGTGVFRYDPAGDGSWVRIDPAGAQGTGPHADFRDLKFLGTNTLLEVGRRRHLRPPESDDRDDQQLEFVQRQSGHLRVLLRGLRLDQQRDRRRGAGQRRPLPERAQQHQLDPVLGGDGQFQAVDATSLGGDVLRYSLSNNNFQASFQHIRFNNADVQVTPTATAGLVTAATNAAPIVITSNNHGLLNGDFVVHQRRAGQYRRQSRRRQPRRHRRRCKQFLAQRHHRQWSLSRRRQLAAHQPDHQRIRSRRQPVVITTANNHRLNTGDEVCIQGMTGTYAALNNSSYYVTVTDATHYTLNGTTSDGTTASGRLLQHLRQRDVEIGDRRRQLSGLNATDLLFAGFGNNFNLIRLCSTASIRA